MIANMSKAYATCEIVPSFENGRDVLKGVVEINADTGQWALFSVFGFTVAEIRERGYLQADANCKGKGWRLESFKINPTK